MAQQLIYELALDRADYNNSEFTVLNTAENPNENVVLTMPRIEWLRHDRPVHIVVTVTING